MNPYTIIVETNVIAQSHQVRERKSIHNTRFFSRGSSMLKTPLSLLYNELRNHETIQCTLLTRVCCTILALSLQNWSNT